MPQKAISLRLKIILLVSAAVCCTALIMGGLNYHGIRKIAIEKEIEKIAGETRLAALHVKAAYAEMKNDALVVSRFPSVHGMIRSIQNGGVDPSDGSTRKHWHQRLNAVFVSMMQARPHYMQLRYIGVADNGLELARVTRHKDGQIQTIETDQMQERGSEPYFQDASKLQLDEFYYSKITYNGDLGKIGLDSYPDLRLAIPVFDDINAIFGIIIINLNYSKFIEGVLNNINSNNEIYISDQQGNYIRKNRSNKPDKLHFVEDNASSVPGFIHEFVSDAMPDGRFDVENFIGYRHRLLIAGAPSNAAVSAFALVPRAELFSSANALTGDNLIGGAILVIGASLAAAVLGYRLTRPIAEMTAQIAALGRDGGIELLDLPVHRGDEVGELARAFHDLKAWLDMSDDHRQKLATQLDAFIANSVDGFIIVNEQGVIEKVNPAPSTLFGYERGELLGKSATFLMRELAGGELPEFGQAQRETDMRKYVGTLRDEVALHKDGSLFPITLSISELQFGDRIIFMGIIRDMTAIREAQTKIEHYAAELEHSNQELDQFAYVAAHDLKAPLRVINNASRWLEEDLADKLSDEDRENMALLRNRVHRMEKFLDDLLVYSRVGKVEDERYQEIVSGGLLIHDILLLLAPPPAMKIIFAESFDRTSMPRMPLQQVLYNLINNAIKHHDRESGLIEVGLCEIEEGLRFTVRDDEPGIPEDFHDKIFEMFHTLKPRDQVEGSGMGLALVKKTVERFGGEIRVTSGGRGTEFTFTWPNMKQCLIQAGKAA